MPHLLLHGFIGLPCVVPPCDASPGRLRKGTGFPTEKTSSGGGQELAVQETNDWRTMKPIEAQWLEYSKVLPPNAGRVQVDETRRAFFAGAFVLFNTIMAQLDPGTEATEDDLRRLDEINAELTTWADEERKRTIGLLLRRRPAGKAGTCNHCKRPSDTDPCEHCGRGVADVL